MGRKANIVTDKLLAKTSHEFRHFLSRILLPATFIIIFVYIVISFADLDNTLSYNSFPIASILGIGLVISIMVLFRGRLERHEIKRFIAISLYLLISFIAEITYVYQQFVLGISVPYPSISDIGYLSAYLFLGYHLFSNLVSLKKEGNIQLKNILLIGVAVSVVPIYFVFNLIYISDISIITDPIYFLTDLLYYVEDILLLVSSVIIIITISKNNVLIFHWLSLTLGITFLTVADLGYTYSAQISEQLISETHSLWNILYAISDMLIIAGIFWYGKIKSILYDEEIENILQNTYNFHKNLSKYDFSHFDGFDHKREIKKNFKDKKETFETAVDIMQKAEREIDVLFTKESFLLISYMDEVINFLNIVSNKKNRINIRILAPVLKNRERLLKNRHSNIIFSEKSDNILIKYFERDINFDAIFFIVDNTLLFLISTESNNINSENDYNVTYTDNKSQILIYSNLFERIWLSETANKIS